MTTTFLINALIIFVIGIAFWVIIAMLMESWRPRIIGLIIVIVFSLFFGWCSTVSVTIDQEVWNNGHCTECGGEYKFNGASKYRTRGYYYYTCENCDHTIETNTIKK
jgi:hypothetical protein